MRALLVASLAALIATAPAAHASTPPPPRVVVLTVDGTDMRDWAAAGAFRSMAAFGLLATRTGADVADVGGLRASAYATFGAGTAVKAGPGAPPGRRDGAVLGLLGEALARAPGGGLLATAIGDASGTDRRDAPASLAVMRLDGTTAIGPRERVGRSFGGAALSRRDDGSPAGRRTDTTAMRTAISQRLSWASLVVADTGDAARADRTYPFDPRARAKWIRRALLEASALADQVRDMLTPRDTLVVASLVPPAASVRGGVYLGAVAFSGGHGVPRSGTTRRDGVVSLTDLAPTILERIGIAPPEEMSGRAATIVAAASPRAYALEAALDLGRALRSRRPLTRVWLVAASILSVVAMVVVAAAGIAPRGRTRIARDLLGVALLAAAAAPSAFLIAPLLPGTSVAAVGWWSLIIALVVGLGVRVVFGHERGLGALALATAALYALDLVAGSPLASRSALGFQVAGGGRFYGVDEGMLGVMLAAPLVTAGVWARRFRGTGRAVAIAAAVLFGVAFLAAAPWFGSKFGAPFTLVPAFGVFLVLAAGSRLDRRTVIAIAAATILLSASLAAADALGSPGSASHIGRELTGRTETGSLVARKVTSLVRVTATTVWLPAAAIIAGAALILLVRRRDVVDRALQPHPGLRAALWAGIVGSAFALVSNDTGIVTVAAAAPILGAAFFLPILRVDTRTADHLVR